MQSKVRSCSSKVSVSLLATFSCGFLLAAVAVSASPSAFCAGLAGLDPESERLATPRSLSSAEWLALRGSEGLVGDTALYDLLEGDLEAIANTIPALAAQSFAEGNWVPASGVDLQFSSPAARDAFLSDENEEVTCLLSLFPAEVKTYSSLEDWVVLRFTNLIHSQRLATWLGGLEDVIYAAAAPGAYYQGQDVCWYSPDHHRRVFFYTEYLSLYPSFIPQTTTRVDVGGTDPIQITHAVFASPDDMPAELRAERLGCLAAGLNLHVSGVTNLFSDGFETGSRIFWTLE